MLPDCQSANALPSSGVRGVFCMICCLGLIGCQPVGSPTPAAAVAARAAPPAVAAPPPPAPALVPWGPWAAAQAPAVPGVVPQVSSREVAGILFEGVGFDCRSHRLIVADQPAGPGSRWPDAVAAVAAYHGLAAVNGGFFTPQGQPLGKVVAAGTPAGSWNRASALGSGVWLEAANGTLMLRRREAVPTTVAARELLQAGPMLVENHQCVSGLEASKSSVRSVVLWDGGTRWWIGQASSCTLAALGVALASGAPSGWPVCHALNLDGGRSAELAITAAVSGGPRTRRAPWNRPVRNFLILVAR